MDVQLIRAAEKRHWDYYNVVPEETFLELEPFNNVKVRVQEVGQGEPVLFVHGSPNAGTTWASIVAQLQDFRCIVLDRPGSGLSEPVDITRLDIREFGADLLSSVLDGLGIEKAAVVASSFGGALALFFAAARPERVTRMVQQGCPAFVEGMLMPFFMRMLATNPIGKFIASRTVHHGEHHHGHAPDWARQKSRCRAHPLGHDGLVHPIDERYRHDAQ